MDALTLAEAHEEELEERVEQLEQELALSEQEREGLEKFVGELEAQIEKLKSQPSSTSLWNNIAYAPHHASHLYDGITIHISVHDHINKHNLEWHGGVDRAMLTHNPGYKDFAIESLIKQASQEFKGK